MPFSQEILESQLLATKSQWLQIIHVQGSRGLHGTTPHKCLSQDCEYMGEGPSLRRDLCTSPVRLSHTQSPCAQAANWQGVPSLLRGLQRAVTTENQVQPPIAKSNGSVKHDVQFEECGPVTVQPALLLSSALQGLKRSERHAGDAGIDHDTQRWAASKLLSLSLESDCVEIPDALIMVRRRPI